MKRKVPVLSYLLFLPLLCPLVSSCTNPWMEKIVNPLVWNYEDFGSGARIITINTTGANLQNIFFSLTENESSGNYVVNVTGDTYIEVDIQIPEGTTISLRGNGGTVFRNGEHQFDIQVGSKLIIRDITLDGRGENYHIVVVNNGGTLVMEAGSTITGSGSGSPDGGAVFLDHGTFIMNDGKIYGNSAINGGAVSLMFGTFIMNGGSIYGNNAENGGAVYVMPGTFIMNGGSIYGNNAETSIVYVSGGNAHFEKKRGAIIYGNVPALGHLRNIPNYYNGTLGRVVGFHPSPSSPAPYYRDATMGVDEALSIILNNNGTDTIPGSPIGKWDSP